ncbi:AmmeMemoRadiSam system radical SAM enzyme [bacterium]|nr:AmmeMemoRadiSam system radical SAM enzyme [bacterium]
MSSVECMLCPTHCVLEEEQTGSCRVRINLGGKLQTMAYGNPCSVNIDPIEKKPLFHFYPGSSIFSIATAGCNLHCKFCQNWEISQTSPDNVRNYDMPPQKIIDSVKSKNIDSIAYTYTDPVAFFEYAYDTCSLAKQNMIKNVLVTAGYINQEPLLEFCKVADAANVDLKGFSDKFYVDICGGHLQPVLDTLVTMKKQNVWLEVTNLIVSSLNDDIGMIKEMCEWIKSNLGADVPLHFSRFYPMYKMRNLPLTSEQILREARETAMKVGLNYVYIGNLYVPGAEDTVCPQCNATVIERRGYSILSYSLKGNKCVKCGKEIAGRFKFNM